MKLKHYPSHRGRTVRGSTTAGFGAVIFDLDGVVTDTASVHAAAWKALFDSVLPSLHSPEPFDPVLDYRTYIDGRSRKDGIRAFLLARGLRLTEGTSNDAGSALTVSALAERKQELFVERLKESGVKAYSDTVLLRERSGSALGRSHDHSDRRRES
ncbi:hypothetical protein [Paenarthrobacter sp. Z7-10]|uniref:hypothetical protein n=1 Tax=Paenarthrobacter sp. Z7-10 TaxID=2787635 RepID=UPI0022A95A48|nr:hypothetical protein [Paenarthrobacter sp. Z7-10]